MIRAAAAAKSDFLKAEMLRSTDIVLNDGCEYVYKYGFAGQVKAEKWYDIVKRKINPLEFYREMFEYARGEGLEFIVSVYDLESVAFLKEMQAAAIKIPSSNINHEPLIQAACESGIPLVVDTGQTYLSEVGRAVYWCEKYGAKGLIINHNPEGHPAPAEAHHLRIMQTYKQTFGVPVGLSCHYVGDEILYTAVGLGANLLEKPISFDPAKADLDTCFALNINELKDVVRKVKSAWKALGDSQRHYRPQRDLVQRMGIVAKSSLPAGAAINSENFRFAWPCKGISVGDWSNIKAMTLTRPLAEGTPLRWSDINFG